MAIERGMAWRTVLRDNGTVQIRFTTKAAKITGTNLEFSSIRDLPAVDLLVGFSKRFESCVPRNHNLPCSVLHRAEKELGTRRGKEIFKLNTCNTSWKSMCLEF